MVRTRLLTGLLCAGAVGIAGCGDDDSSGPDLDCTGGPDIAIGQTVNGVLEEGDDLDIDGAFLDRYALAVNRDRTVQIDMVSTQVNAFLWLLDDDGGVVDVDNDGGAGTNARIVAALDRGCYFVEATSSSDGQTGTYTLSVD